MRHPARELTRNQAWFVVLVLASLPAVFPSSGAAQVPELSTSQVPEATIPAGTILTMFRHSDETKYWVSGQMNFIFQFHPSFYAAYSGQNSLLAEYEQAHSRVLTIYTGYQFNQSNEIIADAEEDGGFG